MNANETKAVRIDLYTKLADLLANGMLTKDEFALAVAQNDGLKSVLSLLRRRDLYALLFDRGPERSWEVGMAAWLNGPVTPELLFDFLFCAENTQECESVYAKTFCERGVDIFIHINKTGGSSLNTLHGEAGFDVLANTYDGATIAQLYKNRASRPILLSSHRTLEYYRAQFGLLNAKRVYSIVRDPIDLAISFFNFALTMAEANDVYWGETYKPIVATWKEGNAEDPHAWFLKYLRSDFFRENVQDIYYKFLGSPLDSPKDIPALVNNLLRHGVVLLKPEQLNKFFWGNDDFGSEKRVNQSSVHVSRKSLPFNTLYQLSRILAHDIEFFRSLDYFEGWRSDGMLDFKLITS